MKNRSDMLGGLLLFLVGIGAIIGAIQLRVGLPTEPQPGFFPFVGGIVLVILSAIIFVQGWLKSDGERVVFGEVGRPALILAVMVALIAVLERVGYVICTLIASGLILRILSVKSWRVLIITSLCVSMGTYILFDKLLGIDLPVGFLSRLGL
jgi:putative tricarboxylic transport membrane protein